MTDCVVYYEWSSELNERYKCSVCPAEYKSTVERDKHYDKSHVIPRPQCEMCNKEFPNELALEKHLDIKHLDKAEKYTKECPTCHARVQKLSSHIRQKHENIHKLDLYGGICPHCNKLFSNDYKVKRHITQVHENIRPFTCIECEKSFLDKKDLRRHVRGVHFGEKVNKWRRKSSSSESTHIVKKQFNLTEGLLGGPEKYLPTLDTTAGTFGSTGIYFSADSLGPLVQTQPPDVLVAEEEPPEVLVTEMDLPGIFITEVVSLPEPSDNTEVVAEKDEDGSPRSLSKQYDEYTVLVSEDHPSLDERLDEDPGVSDEEPCQNISDISLLANYKLSLRNCLVTRDTVETETNQVSATTGKPSTLSLRISALKTGSQPEPGNQEKSLVSSLELTPSCIEFYREQITPGSVITSQSEETLSQLTQPDVFSQNSQIFILQNIEETPPGDISTCSEIQIETRSRTDIFKTSNEDSTEERRVVDVDVEEADEMDRFDILPSQQLNGNEAEIHPEETQPLTNISIRDQGCTVYRAGEDLVYSSEELGDRKTYSKRYSVREKDGCRRKYFQHIEHQENQDDFRYKLSRSRVDSTGDIVLELVEKADLHQSKETTAEDSHCTTTTNQSVLDNQTTKYVTVRWGEDVSSPVILSRYPFPSVDGRLPEILFSETTEETQENSETCSENPGKKAEESAPEDIEGCVEEKQQVDNDGVLMIDDDEDHAGVEYDPMDARTLTTKKIKMNIPDPQESEENTVVCPEETCSRVFKGKSYKLQYQRHYERVHLQVKKHVCKYCSFRFYGKNDFIRHCESVHRKIKSLCPIDGCNKPVVRLDLHIKQVHSQTNKVSKDKEDNTCTECNQVFNRVYDMIRHRETVHLGWKKFKCIECARGFIDKRDLIRHHDAVHLKIKKQTRRYSCPTCNKKYRLKKDLVEHCSSQSCSKQNTVPSNTKI